MNDEDDYYPQPMLLRNRPPIVEALEATWLSCHPWIWAFNRPARVTMFEFEGELAGAVCTSLRVGNLEMLKGEVTGIRQECTPTGPIPLALLCGIGPPGRELIRLPAQDPGIQLALQIEGFKGRLRPLGKIVL